MRTTFAAALVFAALLVFVTPAGAQRAKGAPPPPPKPILVEQPLDRGRVEGSTYTNDYFGVSFDVPAGWTIHDAATLKRIEDAAKNVFRGEQDERLKQQLEASVERTSALLSAAKFPQGSARPFNATLVCAAERIPTALVKSPLDYYRVMLHSLRLSKEVSVEVVEPFRTKTVGGTTFGLYTVKITFNLGVLVQKNLVMLKGPYALGLVFSYSDEADAKTFEQVVASVKTAGRRRV